MRLALIQQHATADLAGNLDARRRRHAARRPADGAELVAFAELALTPFYPRAAGDGDVRCARRARAGADDRACSPRSPASSAS